jgi:NADPH2:quinone reductase
VRAARVHAYGPPGTAVVLEDVPDPTPAADEVLVEVRAAAVNYPDVLLVANRYQVPAPLPFTPGSELAGVVAEVGRDVTGLSPGDLVMGATLTGAFAERAVVPARALTRLPQRIDLRLAAAFGVAYTTAYHALRSVGEAKAGDWVVVLGAAGGVGLAAVDCARELGCRTIAAASSRARLELCRAHGAEVLVDYGSEDLRDRIRAATGEGADVVVDPVGGPYAERALRATRWGGRFVTVGFASGEIPRIPLNLVLLKGVVVKGFEVRTFPHHAPEASRRDREEVLELFLSGRIRPHVSAVYPLEQAGAALAAVADRRAVGKVVVDPTLPATGACEPPAGSPEHDRT